MCHKKIISVIISFLIIFHPLPLYADDIVSPTQSNQQSPTPSFSERHHHRSPTETPSETPAQSFMPDTSPTLPAPTESESSSAAELDITPTETPSATTSAVENTGDNTQQQSTDSAQTQTSVDNTNTADVQRNVDSQAITGQNSTQDNIISQTNTGDATASADVVTLANNNITGTDIHQDIVTIPHDNNNDINLSNVPDCSPMSEVGKNDLQDANTGDNSQSNSDYIKKVYTELYNSNKARVINNITLLAVTGQNTSSDIVNTIQTGDATATANIFNLVNTNLAGHCGYFGVINVFGNQTGDIILPSELGYLGQGYATGGDSSSTAVINSGNNFDGITSADNSSTDSIDNSNQGVIDNNIDTNANTGSNSASGANTTQTGNATGSIHLADTTNTNIVGDRWALVLVNYLGAWQGTAENWQGSTQTGSHYTLMWVRLPPQDTANSNSQNQTQNTGNDSSLASNTDVSSDNSVHNSNDATVQNNVRLVADTGNNSAEGRWTDIKTGNASAVVNEATVANTNIMGNNWFFTIINIFGNFVGNVIFSRPDVAITKTANKSDAMPGDDIIYTISVTNKGNYKAENVSVRDALPSNVLLRSYSSGGKVDGNSIQWSVGTLAAGQSGNLTVIVTVLNTPNDVTNNASIDTSTEEPVKSNNSSSATTHIRRVGGSDVVMNYQIEATPSAAIVESNQFSPSSFSAFRRSNNPTINVDSIVENKDDGAEWTEAGKLLASADEVNRREGRNVCTKNVLVCAGVVGSSIVVPSLYFFIRRRNLFQVYLFTPFKKVA